MFTLLVKDLYSSYKDLPLAIYQIQTKYRDEARPRAGILRGREFVMKDSYSFDVDDAGLQVSYDKHRAAYIKTFDRLGLPYVIVVRDVRRDGRLGERGVPRAVRVRRGHLRAQRRRLRRQRRGRDHGRAGTGRLGTTCPTAHVEDTPDTPTIDTLVAVGARALPRPRVVSGGHAEERRRHAAPPGRHA